MSPLAKKSGLILLLLIAWTGCAADPIPGEIARIHHEPVEGRSGYDVVIREAQDAPEVYVRDAEELLPSNVYEIKELRTEELDQYVKPETAAAIKPEAVDWGSLNLRRQRVLLRRYRNLALHETQKEQLPPLEKGGRGGFEDTKSPPTPLY